VKRQRSVSRYAEVLPPSDSKTPTLSQRSESPLFLPLAGSHHPFCKYRFTTILATLVMAHEEDTPKQQSGQEKPVVRRDKVVVTKVTSQELSIIKSNAEQCGMTRSDFIRARSLGYKPRQRLSDTELDGLRQLATCRTDMVNFANALHGLTDNEKIKLFRHQPTMLDWYEKVAYVTNSVTDFLQSAQTVNSYPVGTTNEEAKEEGA
jgi:hypothetical protein